jgi:hypothetical protein
MPVDACIGRVKEVGATAINSQRYAYYACASQRKLTFGACDSTSQIDVKRTFADRVLEFAGERGVLAVSAGMQKHARFAQPLGSDQPTARQLDPGLGLTAPPPITFVPLISQTEAWPLAF